MKPDKETIDEALEASIEAWKAKLEIEDPRKVPMGVEACPLCALFYQDDHCDGCPVQKATGEHFCIGSPYVAASNAWKAWALLCRPRQAFIEAAKKEIAFLESLREDSNK